jgi:hypothetical protein
VSLVFEAVRLKRGLKLKLELQQARAATSISLGKIRLEVLVDQSSGEITFVFAILRQELYIHSRLIEEWVRVAARFG